MADHGVEQKLAAILAADAVGYSALMGADERATVATLDDCRAVFRAHVAAQNGRVVDTAGDSVLAVFPSAIGAVRAGPAVQADLRSLNKDLADEHRMPFRIGVNLGDVIEKADGTVYGDGVNIAARLESLAEPGGLTISGTTFDQVDGRLDVPFDYLGEKAVKNIAKPVRAYRASLSAEDSGPQPMAAGPEAERPSIAVLPFQNLSGDAEQEYFADGIAEDLITALSRIRWLFVTARNSTFTYKGQAVDVKRVGRDMGVRYVVEGSVRRGGNRVRISAQLIDATTGNHVWAQRYDRELADFFDLQDEISETIAGAIEPELGAFERERARSRPPENLGAWEHAQRGFGHLWQFDKGENAQARRMFQGAIGLDPGLGPAHAGLAYSYLLDASLAFTESPADALDAAAGAAQEAIALDDRDALAHTALGRALVHLGDMEAGVAQLETAIELNPSFALAHYGLGQAYLYLVRAEESAAAIDTAIRLSPHDPYMWLWELSRAAAVSLTGDYAEVLVWARRAAQRPASGFFAVMWVAVALGRLGRQDEARAAVKRLLAMKPDFSIAWLKQYLHFAQQAYTDHLVADLQAAGLDGGS